MVFGLELLSILLGWIYTFAWSISFYPAILLNISMKSVEGISLDFIYMSILGFVTYFISNIMLYSSDTVRNQYSLRHPSDVADQLTFPLVRFNDVFYSAHGVVLFSIIWSQVHLLGYKRLPTQRISKVGLYLLICCTLAMISATFFVIVSGGKTSFEWLDVANLAGTIEVIMGTCKYLPQLHHNYARQSTKGWSIITIMLDFTGGSFSLFQLILDGYLNDDLMGVFSNVPKIGLALVTLFFDILFMIQHFVLYADTSDKEIASEDLASEVSPLL